jgi:hypothetical protein
MLLIHEADMFATRPPASFPLRGAPTGPRDAPASPGLAAVLQLTAATYASAGAPPKPSVPSYAKPPPPPLVPPLPLRLRCPPRTSPRRSGR